MATMDPIQLENLDQAIELFGTSNPLPPRPTGLEKKQIIDHSVSGNIFRVFPTKDMAPSSCYRAWADTAFDPLKQAIEQVNTIQEYDETIQQFALQLARYWEVNRGIKLPYGPATKMINLLVKLMHLNNDITLPTLPHFSNVPFDSFTLVPLINIIDELLQDRPYGIAMNQQMTMNYVTSQSLYAELQEAVRTLCARVHKTPLDYELWAWDRRH